MKKTEVIATATIATNENLISMEVIESITALEVAGEMVTLTNADKKDIITLLNEVKEQLSNENEKAKIVSDSICGMIFGSHWGEDNFQSETFKKLLELKKSLLRKKEIKINEDGITTTENFNILCKRANNDRNGNPIYHITIYGKESGYNYSHFLRDKIKYTLLKSNKYSVRSYNIKENIKEIISAIEKN